MSKTHFILILTVIFLIPAFILGSCSGTTQTGSVPKNTETPSIASPSSIGGSSTLTPAAVDRLVIWIPDNLLATNKDQMLALLQKQVAMFTSKNPEITVNIRIKKATGSGSLADTLQSASLAAPDSLPDLVLLSSDELQVNALKGLLIPFDGSTEILGSSDWAPVMRQLAQVQGSTFGLPVLADALVYVSKPGKSYGPSVYKSENPIYCYLNDPESILSIGYYLSAGGRMQTDPGKPGLDQKAIESALDLLRTGFNFGTFTTESIQLNGYADIVSSFSSGKADQMITWYSTIPTGMKNLNIMAVPGVTIESATLVKGSFWTMANPNPSRRSAAIALAETLVDPEFLTSMARISGGMPVRQSASINQDPYFLNQFKILQSGNPTPDGLLLVTIGPVFRSIVQEIHNGTSKTTAELAKQMMDSMQRP
jgi:multiple sugar transport system substrate-binding protein